MLERQRTSLRRARLQPRASNPAVLEHAEPHLGSVAAQARRVAGALTLLVAIGVVAGCFTSPTGVDCSRHPACSAADPCACLDVPGCGPLRVDRGEACEQSCPLAFECTITSTCPARVRCAGLVPGRTASLTREP